MKSKRWSLSTASPTKTPRHAVRAFVCTVKNRLNPANAGATKSAEMRGNMNKRTSASNTSVIYELCDRRNAFSCIDCDCVCFGNGLHMQTDVQIDGRLHGKLQEKEDET